MFRFIDMSLSSQRKETLLKLLVTTTTLIVFRKIKDVIYRKRNNLPPGPVGLPLLGSLLSFAKNSRSFAYNLREKYGLISMIYFGLNRVILISDYKLLNQYFSDKLYINRRSIDSKADKYNNASSFASNSGEKWKHRRQILNSSLMLQLNSKTLDLKIKNYLINIIFPIIDEYARNKKEWKISHECNFVTFATIYSSVFNGQVPSPMDKLFLQFLKTNDQVFRIMHAYVAVLLLFPQWMYKYIAIFNKYNKSVHDRGEVIKQWVVEYQNRRQANGSLNNTENNKSLTTNYCDSLLDRLSSKGKDKVRGNYNYKLTFDEIISDISITFGSGMHSTARAIEQCIRYLAYFGNSLQDQLFDELKQCVDDTYDSDVQTANILLKQKELNKFRAFIYEVLRTHGNVILSLGRYFNKDGKKTIVLENGQDKYNINCNNNSITVFGNLYAINNDKQYWEAQLGTSNVFEFDYKRFINNKSGKFDINRARRIVTFGVGRRDCVGQQLAIKEIYLVLSLLILNYKFQMPNKYKRKNMCEKEMKQKFFHWHTRTIGVIVKKR